ncbi:hypothetical protein PG994_006475 [Apiospora phragmitis]|uniref:Uncharacterized protein n=1 Tax=Apiospora phragmitis TaxID=2905665 RepID=A0ABR1VIR4_9PEZI
MSSGGGGNFEFIVTDQNNRGIDDKTREKIRKKAMKATAAARKGSGSWGKQNLRQVPVFVQPPTTAFASAGSATATPQQQQQPPHAQLKSEPNNDGLVELPLSTDAASSSTHVSSKNATSNALLRRPRQNRPPRPMPPMGLETVTAKTGLNILDLSALTMVQVGQTASAILELQSNELSGLVSRRRRSYLSFVPIKYGHSPYLDDAVKCLAMRARRVLVPSARPPETQEILQYSRALQSLQNAVNGQNWHNADVLCTVELLCLYELLESKRSHAWERHIAGAARLIQMRGPMRFLTPYDMSLLFSLMGPLVFESCRLNQACFLDEEPWQRLLKYVISPDELLSARSHIAIFSWCIFIKFPRLLRDVTNLMYGDTQDDQTVLYERALAFRAELHQWRKEFDAIVAATGNRRNLSTFDTDVRSELSGANLELLSSANRLLTCLSGENIEDYERQAVDCARAQRQLSVDTMRVNPWAGFYLRQITNFGEATLSTTKLWLNNPNRPGSLVDKGKFRIWRDLLFQNARRVLTPDSGGELV